MSQTHDVMQSYFEELLQDTPDLPASANLNAGARLAALKMSENDTRAVQPRPLAQTRPAPPVSEEIYKEDVDRAALESLQKQKLQALLDQQKQIAEHSIDVRTVTLERDLPVEPTVRTKQTEAVTEVSIETVVLEKTESKQQIKVPELLCWHENGRPLWAQNEFDVLLFNVSGLTLAVPLIALGQIQQINDDLTPIFGQSEWFMGLLRGPNGNIKTVNTALFVMPEKYNDKFLETARFVISIDGLSWGLAVDSVNQPSRIHPDEVKWRSDRSKRPWLAGTVKSAMCALIDIPQMGKLLLESEK